MSILLQVSIGDALDRLSILEIKQDKIKDCKKLEYINKEITNIQSSLQSCNIIPRQNVYYNILKYINLELWKLTEQLNYFNDLTLLERSKLCYDTFLFNKYRYRTKSILNFKSDTKEQKSHSKDTVHIEIDQDTFYDKLTEINKYSILYDDIVFIVNDKDLQKIAEQIYPFATCYTACPFAICCASCIESPNTKIFDNVPEHGAPCERATSRPCQEPIVRPKASLCDQKVFRKPINGNCFEFPNITYISGGKLGDFILQLTICNEYYLKTGKKADIYICNYTENFMCSLNVTLQELTKLLLGQAYISSINMIEDKYDYISNYDIDLSKWRLSNTLNKCWDENDQNRPNFMHIFKDVYNINLGEHKWLHMNTDTDISDIKNSILLNITTYRYVHVNYNQLLLSGRPVIFICYNREEYIDFKNMSDFNISYIQVHDLQEMALYIRDCYCFVGNLSNPLNIAIAQHKYCLAVFSTSNGGCLFKNMNIPNFYWYENDTCCTKKITDI